MKRERVFKMMVATALLVGLTTSCKEKDYREKWIGDYVGEFILYWSEDGSLDTTKATINVSLWEDSCIAIAMGKELWKPKIDEAGMFLLRDSVTKCDGWFINDSIRFNGATSPNLPNYGYSYEGKKQRK